VIFLFHQPHNTFGNHIYNAAIYDDVVYSPHFHMGHELIYGMQGKVTVTVNDCPHTVGEGEFLWIFPFQSHAFTVETGQKIWVGVFSEDYIPSLARQVGNLIPTSPKFHTDNALHALLQQELLHKNVPAPLTLKGCLYLLAQCLSASTDWEEELENRQLTMRLIRYVEENFTEQITLRTAAQALGYHFQYLSRVFSQTIGMNFRTLVNQYRFDDACARLEAGNCTVTEAALAAGFQSVRNFNRVYKEKTGQPPLRRKDIKKGEN
jgi:AraC-like DNA-binding protein